MYLKIRITECVNLYLIGFDIQLYSPYSNNLLFQDWFVIRKRNEIISNLLDRKEDAEDNWTSFKCFAEIQTNSLMDYIILKSVFVEKIQDDKKLMRKYEREILTKYEK